MEGAVHFIKTSLGLVVLCLSAIAQATTNSPPAAMKSQTPPTAPPTTARGLYNAGTGALFKGKLDNAETLLRDAVETQDERIQPRALYNLGQARFDEGKAALKKSPNANQVAVRSSMLADASNRTIDMAETALRGNDVQEMVAAYLNGRGMRRELHAATKAVERALEAHAETLHQWRRALDDFQSAAELNPADTNAAQNARTVERAIAKLVDSIREMQQAAMAAGSKAAQLGDLMKQLRGRIPKDMMPPGAPGDDEDADFPMGWLRGRKEAPTQSGQQREMRLTPEEAGRLLDGINPNGNRQLPVVEGTKGKPESQSGLTW